MRLRGVLLSIVEAETEQAQPAGVGAAGKDGRGAGLEVGQRPEEEGVVGRAHVAEQERGGNENGGGGQVQEPKLEGIVEFNWPGSVGLHQKRQHVGISRSQQAGRNIDETERVKV